MSASYEQIAVKERIRDATDIVELVGRYIPLRRSGRNYVGVCPFHDDHKPSLYVNPDRQTFRCFVCQTGGDVFTFIQKIENVDFVEAKQILADKAGIALPKWQKAQGDETTGDDGTEIKKDKLLQAADWVAKIYHDALLHSDEADVARKYLDDRNVSVESIKKFRIGYAPIDRSWLVNKAKNLPDKIKILEIIGNIKHQNSDFFRGRLIFPIRNEQGRTVAFGGRLIPNSPLEEDHWHKDRKYLNSSETRLFSKNKILYGLDTAKQRIKETRRALIMEGYTDCITAHQFGFGEAVAVLGTALGPAHIRRLTEWGAEKIILMLDGDKAGQMRAEDDRVLTDFIAQGADMAVLILPDGLDPCDFLEQRGAAALDDLLQKETVDALEHVFRVKTRGIDLKNDIIKSSKALDAILGIIAHAPLTGTSPDDPIRTRIEKTVQNLAVRFTMPEDQVRRRLKEKQQKADDRRQTADGSGEPATASPERWSQEEMPDTLEREMLELWVIDPTAIYAFWEHVLPNQFRSPITLSIYEQCSELIDHCDKPATFDNLMTAFDDPYMKNYLIELDESGRQKFFPDDDNEIESALREELTERWKEPDFIERKAKLIEEIIAAFDKREKDREHRDGINKLRSDELTDEEKTQQLLELQRKLRRR
jgi:DNA primase